MYNLGKCSQLNENENMNTNLNHLWFEIVFVAFVVAVFDNHPIYNDRHFNNHIKIYTILKC